MKRALAERAKQSETSVTSGPANGVSPVQVPSGQPPRKLARIDEEQSPPQEEPQAQQQVKLEPITVPSQVTSTPRPSPQGTPREGRSSLKRQRPAEEEEEENESSGFYLKHQNRALASELKGLQYQLRLLEKERDVRRQQCQEASQALQALESTWTQMEVALQLGMPPEGSKVPSAAEPPMAAPETSQSAETNVRNTGTGDNVELIGVLLDLLAALGKIPEQSSDDADADLDPAILNPLRDMKRAASRISQRAATLQQWIWTLLQRVNSPETHESISQAASLVGQVAALKGQCRELEVRMAELAMTRDEAVNSDRRVRRGLYRLAAGRMKLEEVLRAVEDDDKDGSAAIMAMEVADQSILSEKVATTVAAVGGDEEGEVVDGAHILQLKKQLQDLEEIASSRESQIEQLLKDREESSKRINSLSLLKSTEPADISEDDVKRSSLYTETATKLVTAERQLEELRIRMENIMEKYATAKGDAELATKCVEDHMEKFKKRWAELTGSEDDDFGALYDDENNVSDEKEALLSDTVAQAKRIVDLEHKLIQALENVRQADAVRVSLTEAQLMNETLQQKLEEFKAKNAALMAGRTASRSTSESTLSSSKDVSSSDTPISAEKAERLQREYKKMKKELASAVLSKEAAKAKQDRAEKERDNLMKTNIRLLKQSSEKDDMNAKSLSTILHLKSLTEQYEQEKIVREQEAKSVEQISLAARLAANAKERVTEESLKEKKLLEDKLEELEKECELLKRGREDADGALSKISAEMSSLEKSVGTMKDRCEELTTESIKLQEDKRKLVESLAIAQRESSEAAKKVMNMRASGGSGHSEFTAEQLTTQVSVLKGRLACPVCNHRDKACILLRCRHMFCKPCVDENVKNRSRKCPACGQRFDTKDVADVWL